MKLFTQLTTLCVCALLGLTGLDSAHAVNHRAGARTRIRKAAEALRFRNNRDHASWPKSRASWSNVLNTATKTADAAVATVAHKQPAQARFAEAHVAVSARGEGSDDVRARPRSAGMGVGSIKITKDMIVEGSVTAASIDVNNVTVQGKMSVGGALTADKVTAALFSADVVETGTLAAKAGGTIIVDGDLELSNGGKGMSFLAMGDVIMGGVKQWRLVEHDDFQAQGDAATKGWSNAKIGTCNGASDRFLGGHCAFSSDEASKMFENLPAHSHVRITASYHFLDQWAGETGFATVDGRYVWADRCGSKTASIMPGINVCGGDAADLKLASPIDVSFPHSADSLKLAFGSSLKGDACEKS